MVNAATVVGGKLREANWRAYRRVYSLAYWRAESRAYWRASAASMTMGGDNG